MCNEGDLAYTPSVINGQMNVADASTQATAGLQKWVLTTAANGSQSWVLQYTIQDGLDLGVPYSVANYPTSIEPATGGCRNITGVVNHDGTATIYAVTSTLSQNGDNGADPNKLVKVTDLLSATHSGGQRLARQLRDRSCGPRPRSLPRRRLSPRVDGK